MVIALLICTCTYIKGFRKNFFSSYKKGFLNYLRIAAIIGERKSGWIAGTCVVLAIWGLIA